MIVKNYNSAPSQKVVMDGARGASVKVLVGPAEDAPTFAMRLFTLEPGGHTPYHKHPFEHEVIYISGSLAVVTEEGEKKLEQGDIVYMPPNQLHNFVNMSDSEPASMICLVPIEYQK